MRYSSALGRNLVIMTLMSFLFLNATELGKIKGVSAEKSTSLGNQLVVEQDGKIQLVSKETLIKLLRKGANPNTPLIKATTQGDETPFMLALRENNDSIINLMVEAKGDVNFTTTKGNPLIVHYLLAYETTLAEKLLGLGKVTIPPSTQLYENLNLAGIAAGAGSIATLKALQNNGENLLQIYKMQVADTLHQFTLLNMALYYEGESQLTPEKKATAQWLLDQKIDVNAIQKSEILNSSAFTLTNLVSVAMHDDLEWVKKLIEAGADIHMPSSILEEGLQMVFDPVVIPVMNKNNEMCRYMIEKGALTSGKLIMKSGDSTIADIPLVAFLIGQKNVALLKDLQSKGINLSQPLVASPLLGFETKATTILEYLRESGSEEIIALFADELSGKAPKGGIVETTAKEPEATPKK